MNLDIRCCVCKYWERSLDRIGKCSNFKFNYISIFENADTEEFSDNLVYCGEYGWNSDFRTGENFGCIHFENK